MEAEKLSETITKTGGDGRNPHVIKALIISLFAVALSFAGLGGSEELKTISADNIIESNLQTISEFRSLRQSLLQIGIDQLEINLASKSTLTSAEKNNLVKIISGLKKEILLSESNADAQDGKKEIELKLKKIRLKKPLLKLKTNPLSMGRHCFKLPLSLYQPQSFLRLVDLCSAGALSEHLVYLQY